MEYHSKHLDEYSQNAYTTCEHMEILIQWMYEGEKIIRGDIIYDTTYGWLGLLF